MKKTVMYSETRTWIFDLNLNQGADLDDTLCALVNTDGFYCCIDDSTSDGFESGWKEIPSADDGGEPDYTEEFRQAAERELVGNERKLVLSALVNRG